MKTALMNPGPERGKRDIPVVIKAMRGVSALGRKT